MAEKDPKTVIIPGYTGFIPSEEEENMTFLEPPGHYIPGYAGFVKGIKSENLYANTYGHITQISQENTYHKGFDLPPDLKFLTTVQETYDDKMLARRDDHFSFTRLSTSDNEKEKHDLASSFYHGVDYPAKPPVAPGEVTLEYDQL